MARFGVVTNPTRFGQPATSTASFPSFTSSQPGTTEDLLNLARAEGGSLEAAAEELVHPNTSILSTMGNAFKNTFRNFVEAISVPGQFVAGVLSPDDTIREAIEFNISPSDVIWGDKDPDNTTAQKVGGFLVRTATDILLDPITYITFGGARGVLGISALPKVSLGLKAAKKVKVAETTAKRLSEEGLDVFKYVKNLEHQAKGTAKALNISKATGTNQLAGKELKVLLEQTIDAPLNLDYSRRAMTNLLEKYPQLTETLLDKGGIKFFGKSVLSGQRISTVRHMIPGMTHLDNFVSQASAPMRALFDPRLVKTGKNYVRLPEEFINIEQAAKDLSKNLGDDRLLNLSDIIRANKLNKNEAKFLIASTEAGKIPIDKRLANAYKQALDFDEKEFNFLKDSGVAISRRDLHIPHVLVKNEIKQIPFKVPPKQKVGAAIKRKLEGTIFEKDPAKLTQLERVVLDGDQAIIDTTLDSMRTAGFEIFDDNIITALAKRSLDNTRSGVSRQFMRSVAEGFGKIKSEAPDGYKAIDTSVFKAESARVAAILGKNGEDIVYHPAVAKRVEEFVSSVINDDATDQMLKNFDRIQNLWKASVTTVFPAFHGRNAISNVFLHFMDIGVNSLDPRVHAMSVSLMNDDRIANRLQRLALGTGKQATKAQDDLSKLLSKQAFRDASGHAWSFGELRQVIKDRNVAFSRQITSAVDIIQDDTQFINTLFQDEGSLLKKVIKGSVPITQEFKPFKWGQAVGRKVEEQARLVDFLVNLKATGDVTHAAQRTKQFLFDYNNLTNFERTVMKRLIPFYTFTRKNLEVQVKGLLQTPGRTAAQFTALRNLGDLFSGEELTAEDKAKLPKWMQSGINTLKSKKGETVEILGSLGTPLEQPFQAFQANQLLASISPLIRIPAELATGYSFFQGKPLSDVTNAAAFKSNLTPKFIKDWIGFTEVNGKRKDGSEFTYYASLRPDRMHVLLNLPPTSRVLSSIKQMGAVDVSAQAKILQGLIGIRPFTFDLEREAEKREKELQGQLEQLLDDAGVGYTLKRFIAK